MKKLTAKVISARLTRHVLHVLRQGNVKLVAVTGSIGKTSARVATSQLLSKKYKLVYAEHSYNVPIAIELSFFGLEVPTPLWNAVAWQQIFRQVRVLAHNFPYDIVVIEVNEDDFDLIEPFIARLHPHIGVITGVAPAHMEKLQTMERVSEQTTGLARYAEQIIYNADFAQLRHLGKNASALGYGLGAKDEVRFGNIQRQADGYLKADLHLSGQKFAVTTKMISRQGLYSLLAAASVASQFEMTPAETAKGLAAITPVRGRMNLLPAVNSTKLIDDSYNSSPFAAIAALATLVEMQGARKIAVLGGMNELGDYTSTGHTEVAKAAAKTVDLLVTVGELAERYIAPVAEKAGLDKSKIKIFRTPYEAGHYLKNYLQKDDVVLVKGSQDKVFTEEVSRIILAPSIKPGKVLVRQSPAWKRRKKKAFAL